MPIRLGEIRAVVIFSDQPAQLAAWYRRVFVLREIVSSDGFIGLAADHVSLFIQQTSEGHRPGIGGIRPHFTVADCQHALDELVAAGARQVLPVSDTGDELVAAVQDPEGNPMGLLQHVRR